MPPKKKCRINPPPGVGRQYLIDKFSSLPSNINVLKNGHILHLYESNNKSRAQAEKLLKAHYQPVTGEYEHKYDNEIKSLLNKTVGKFKKLTCEAEFAKYAALCNEMFKVKQVSAKTKVSANIVSPPRSTSPMPSTSANENKVPSTSDSNAASCSSRSSRSANDITPRKARLRKQLKFASIQNSAMKIRHQAVVKKLRDQMKKPTNRVMNQTLKRQRERLMKKSKEFLELKRKLEENSLNIELQKCKRECQKLKDSKRKLQQRQKRMVSEAQHNDLLAKLKEKDEVIRVLEDDNLLLKEQIEQMTDVETDEVSAGKKYSGAIRMKVFDCIVSKVSTANTPGLLTKLEKRNGVTAENIPHRSTVELMARELGAISELQTAELLMSHNNVTMGFDATTQEGVHVNAIHFTTNEICMSAAVDELSGGTAEDYANHITQTMDSLARTYVSFHSGHNFEDVRKKMISNISNTMTDRCASNHAAIRIVNSRWGTNLNELNCHLHPLDSMATKCRSALKQHEASRGSLFGSDCMAGNIILSMNKLRYKDGKGDPRAFVAFLIENDLPKGLLPRYRGNRLHILFHNAAILFRYRDLFTDFLSDGNSLGGLRGSLSKDFSDDVALTELQVLGLVGKVLTGPWMRTFYHSASSDLNNITGLQIVKQVYERLSETLEDPLKIVKMTNDFFGQPIEEDGWNELKRVPQHHEKKFAAMMGACLQSIVDVLTRQYAKFFSLEITEQMRLETASVRCHNMDAEEIMGMFSAAQNRAPNATICYLSCRMRACKNQTVDYLDSMNQDTRDSLLNKAVKIGRAQRDRRRKAQRDLRVELVRRQALKRQKRDDNERKNVEKFIKQNGMLAVVKKCPHLNLDDSLLRTASEILEGKVVGRQICHEWNVDGDVVLYNGYIKKLYATKKYKVAYWTEDEEQEDATDYNIPIMSLVVDFLYQDLVFWD